MLRLSQMVTYDRVMYREYVGRTSMLVRQVYWQDMYVGRTSVLAEQVCCKAFIKSTGKIYSIRKEVKWMKIAHVS